MNGGRGEERYTAVLGRLLRHSMLCRHPSEGPATEAASYGRWKRSRHGSGVVHALRDTGRGAEPPALAPAILFSYRRPTEASWAAHPAGSNSRSETQRNSSIVRLLWVSGETSEDLQTPTALAYGLHGDLQTRAGDAGCNLVRVGAMCPGCYLTTGR